MLKISDLFELFEEEFKSPTIEDYISNLPIKTDYTELTGSFAFDTEFRNFSKYQEMLCNKYSHINLTLIRPFIILSNNESFYCRDNGRVELGLQPFNHRINVIAENNTINVVSVDEFVLLDDNDCCSMNKLLSKFPPTKEELTTVIKH